MKELLCRIVEMIISRQKSIKPYLGGCPEFRHLIQACRQTSNLGDKTKSIADVLDYAANGYHHYLRHRATDPVRTQSRARLVAKII